METEGNRELRLAWDFVEHTGTSVFITGKAGTGKTTFLKNLKAQSSKRIVVVAPTGVAAINAGGVTIHSFFQLPLSPYLPETSFKSKYDYSQEKRNIISSMDLLVIDEISMVRSDLLDAVDNVLRRFRQHHLPFGGVQLLMIGDLQQLAPVVTEQDAHLLGNHYDTPFFFGSKALALTPYVTIELKRVYRQSDSHFLSLLNNIRTGHASDEVISALNTHCDPDFRPPSDAGYIRLTTHNALAQKYNEEELRSIKSPSKTFVASIDGVFPDYAYPTDVELTLKQGAQVMFVKNDTSPEHLFYNGKIGHVVDFRQDAIVVKCPGEENEILVEPMQWENAKYVLNEKTKEIESEVQGLFTQYPLRLAWAITIHKSQGLTFEKAIIDASLSFASGQVYVALSRCKSLEGLVLASPLSRRAVISDQRVSQYIGHQEEAAKQSIAILPQLKEAYSRQLLKELFDFTSLSDKEEWLCRVLDEHLYRLRPTLVKAHQEALKSMKTKVTAVAAKWQVVLSNTAVSTLEGEAFGERIANSVTYFYEMLTEIFSQLAERISISIDNKLVKTRLESADVDFLTAYFSKVEVLKLLKVNGFSVANYLRFKQVAMLNALDRANEKAPTQRRRKSALSVEVDHPALYARLDAWRQQRADMLDIAPAIIMQQRAMVNVVNALPGNLTALRGVDGVGRKTVEKYGADILRVIGDYAAQKGLTLSYGKQVNDAQQTAEAPMSSKQVTFEMFKSGKSMADISVERGYSESTIFDHLAAYVLAKQLPLSVLVPDAQLKEILKVIAALPDDVTIKDVKAHCSDDITYAQIRLVMRIMKR